MGVRLKKKALVRLFEQQRELLASHGILCLETEVFGRHCHKDKVSLSPQAKQLAMSVANGKI